MDYLILGGDGQLAQAFVRLLGDRSCALNRHEADLCDAASLDTTLARHQPRVVLNCAAYNQVDLAESDSTSAWNVNAIAPGLLADWCRKNEVKLVHYSTNYVYGLDEARQRPYSETDLPGPTSVYGTTKLAGEYLVLSRCPQSLVLRTCGLFGRRAPGSAAKNFVATMLRVAREGKALRVVDDQICTPTLTDDLARATLSLLEAEEKGLFNLTNSGQCSWFEFAAAIFEVMKMEAGLTPVRTKYYPTPARRPRYSTLDCAKFESIGGPLRSWRDALREYLLSEPRD